MQVGRARFRPGEWQTGEEHVDDLPWRGGYPAEMRDKPAYALWGDAWGGKAFGSRQEGSASHQLDGEVMAHRGDDGSLV
jgi:hypothetical protein